MYPIVIIHAFEVPSSALQSMAPAPACSSRRLVAAKHPDVLRPRRGESRVVSVGAVLEQRAGRMSPATREAGDEKKSWCWEVKKGKTFKKEKLPV